MNPKVVIKPIDHNQGQNALNPPNQPAHLPDQPPNIPNPLPPPPIPQHLMNQQNPSNQQNHPDQQNLPNQQNQPDQQDQPQDQQNLPNLPNQPNILDLPNPLVLPQNQHPPNPPNPPNQPNQVNQPNPMDQPNPPQPQLMNWSYFKSEFSGKAEEDTPVHLLKTNDWMDTYNFPEDIKVRRFCLTLMGEARLWYESLKPIDMDWNALQTCFRQQYSKFGSLREQYFHVWRLFRYDENEDTIDSYILKVKQVASLLNYGEPETLELFKNTLPSKLYWILFPINNLREAVETAKRVMNKEKLDKQLTGQASSISPFMKLGDDTSLAQQKMLNPQEIEAISSRIYNMSYNKIKQESHLSPKFIKEGEEVRDKVMIEIDPETIIDKVKILVKIGAEMITEGMGTCKISVEIIAEVEAEILTETIVMIGVDQEKEGYHPEGMITIIIIPDKTQILDSDQGLGVDPTQE